MQTKRIEGSQERTVLIGMIVDRSVLGAVASKWIDGMFSSRWGNLVAKWCVDHYRRYRKPPGKNIAGIFDDWAQEAKRDKETVQLIEKFLSSLSGEYAQLKQSVNTDYIIDLASAYFTKVKLKELSDAIASHVEDGDLAGADELVHKYSKVEVGANMGIDVLEDKEAIRKAFTAKQEPLITYPHGLGIFYGGALERDGFIGFMGPEKRGKTWQLLDIAWNAMLQGKRVAFFEVGDLSETQIMRRFMIRAAGIPGKPRKVNWPSSIVFDEDDDKNAVVQHEEKRFKKGCDFETAEAACDKIIARRTPGVDGPLIKLSTHPNSSISIYGIMAIIDTWERRGWVPDVIVIDYADILEPPKGFRESRDQVNATWKAMRAISQSLHCLVVTATQAKASSYSAHTLSMEDFSEDKRKFGHVTGMVGLSQTPAEKSVGLMRLNWVALREEDYTQTECCHVATCLPLGNPAVLSIM